MTEVSRLLRNRITKLSRSNHHLITMILACTLIAFTLLSNQQAFCFHLSFGNRLLRSASPNLLTTSSNPNPQLNPASTLIRPIECKNVNNQSEAGICMFSIDCMQNKGVPLSICKHNYFVGTCCKLPDYNNFVGIVYDLRDTETNQILEARRIAQLTQLSLSPSSQTISYDVLSTNGSMGLPSVSMPPADTIDLLPPITSQQQQVVQSADQVASPSAILNASPMRPEDKYIISSTSLFPSLSGGYPTATSQLPPVDSMAPQQTSGLKSPVFALQPVVVKESARNADGQIAATPAHFELDSTQLDTSKADERPLVVSRESDSFQIQSASTTTTPATTAANQSLEVAALNRTPAQVIGNNNGHEIIKDSSSAADNLETASSTVLNSAHSLSSFVRPLDSPDVQSLNQFGPTVVLSNNHHVQPAIGSNLGSASKSSTLQANLSGKITPIQQQVAQQPTGDQEFTLSSVQSPTVLAASSSSPSSSAVAAPQTTESPSEATGSHSATTASATTEASPATSSDSPLTTTTSTSTTAAAATTTTTTTQLAFQSQTASLSVEPAAEFSLSQAASTSTQAAVSTVDQQTTTPFTTSLSTALLPNVSSHPWAPTQAPPSLVSFPSSGASLLYSSTSYRQSPTASPSTTAHHQAASPSEQPALVGYSQLYSNQHSGGASSSSPSPHFNVGNHRDDSNHPTGYGYPTSHHSHHNHHHQGFRPNLILSSPTLQAASKIVTGSSSANNLIPGLSNLQSAILSHIPFKLASGLSSGLTSYLQAAMKPNGHQGKPLISSNMAPSLQYQQQQQQLHNSTSNNNNNSKHSATTSITTAATSSPSTSPTTSGTVKFPIDASTSRPSNDGEQSLHSRDYIKEAQQICGRPQVAPPATSGSDANGATRKRVARIVGGNQSLFGQWPWMVSLRQWRKGAFLHKCGAALLNENWAITAAHCVENVKAPDLLLRLGEFDVSNQDEPYPYAERRVKSVVSHPSFDPKTFEYDLALLKFAEPVKFERNIVPVCVPSGNDSYVDRMATVIGWGRLYEDGPLPDIIQHVDVPIITNNECERMYKSAGYIEEIPDMFICAGINKGGRDSCEGDSGGPLTMVDNDGRSYLVGIISWGIGCALPSQPGVYTRITAFSGWINQIID